MSLLTTKWRHLAGAAALVASLGVGACTTVEGTNALVDPVTFEREVATSTLQGLGLIEREKKEPIATPRAPLALPKDTAGLPPPQEESKLALLPEDSDKVQIDASGLSDEDIRRLRNARVVDNLRALSGRPLTEDETRRLTARMTAARIKSNPNNRPLYLPPDQYFTTVNGQDLICLAANGDLVPLDDPACPPEIAAALKNS